MFQKNYSICHIDSILILNDTFKVLSNNFKIKYILRKISGDICSNVLILYKINWYANCIQYISYIFAEIICNFKIIV